MINFDQRAARIRKRLDELAKITEENGCITRTYLSEAMKSANRLVGSWMKEAGLIPGEDSFGNLIGRWSPGHAKKRFLIGSHLDSVRNAGRFDGPLGVLIGIECADCLRVENAFLPFAVEVIGFADEEGVRFHRSYLGSKGYCGTLTEEDLALLDANGISLREALEADRGDSERLASPPDFQNALGYLEVHLEQGPVLEDAGIPLGVVDYIAGQSRFKITWNGKASHAGTTPFPKRRDALVGAAAFVQSVFSAMRQFDGLVATVGEMRVSPNVSNVIPGTVIHTLDVRHQSNQVRATANSGLKRQSENIAAGYHLGVSWDLVQEDESIPCRQRLLERLLTTSQKVTGAALSLSSGAGHDAVVLAQKVPVAMLFVRCRDGLSHHPDEFVSVADIEAALKVTVEFVKGVG